jgi:hypothetical protein
MAMTILAPSSPLSAIEALRGDKAKRPLSDLSSASGLRAQLEDGIYSIMGKASPLTPLVVRSSSLRQNRNTIDIQQASLSLFRGILVTQVLRLLSVGVEVTDPFSEALSAWRCEKSGTDLVRSFNQLDKEQVARLEADVNAHASTLKRSLGVVSATWMPRSCVRASQRFAGGHVLLFDVVDLMVGSITSKFASVALFDVTTSPLDAGAERTMRFHALMQTLKTSVVPLRTSMFSSATGELWTSDVDYEILSRSVDEVLSTLNDMWKYV